MKPVICVTDYHDLPLEAARTASAFAQRWNERMILVHSIDEREQFPLRVRERLVAIDSRRLSEEARQLRERGFNFEEKMLRGMPEDGVAGFAWRSGAGLVVVGSAPTANLEHWALGCIAEEVSDTCLVPVLTVRSAASFERWLAGEVTLKVWIAVDPAARPDALLNRIDELRELGACELSAAYVFYPENPVELSPSPTASRGDRSSHAYGSDRDPLEAMARELEARHVNLTDRHVHRATSSQLINKAAAAEADLIVVTSHPRKDLTLLPHRSLCHGIVCHAPMSVLCVPESDIEPPHHPARQLPAMTSFPDRAGPSGRPSHDEAVR